MKGIVIGIGISVSVIDRRTIGEWSIAGAGSTVIHDVETSTAVVGAPDRVVKSSKGGRH